MAAEREPEPMSSRRNPRPRPTDAQLEILEVLWRGGAATVREVHEALPSAKTRRYTTTLKLMQVMAEKGLVRRNESARSHVYEATTGERELKDALVGELVDKAFGGSAARLAMSALSKKPASKAELELVRRLLDDLEGGRRQQR
jgi:predicted transcriptional regulator